MVSGQIRSCPRRAGEVVRTLDTFAGAAAKQWWPNRDRRAYSPEVDLTAPAVATDEKEAARVRLLLLGICLFGAALRVVHLGQASLWLDELTSWSLSHHASLAEVLRDARHDFHPPGHLVILYWTQQLLGDSEASLRLPSLVAGVASLPLLFALGKRLFNPTVGLLATAMLAGSLAGVQYSREGRAYALLVCASIACGWAQAGLLELLRAKRPMRAAPLLLAIFSAAAACWLHYFGLYLVILQGGFALLLCRRDRRALLWLLVADAAVFLLFLPWLPELWLSLQVGGSSWIPPPSASILFDEFKFFFNDSTPLAIGALLLIGARLLLLGRAAFRDRRAPLGAELAVVLWLLVPLAIVFAYSRLVSPLLTLRNMLICAPAAYLLVAQAISALLRGRERWVQAAALLIALAMSAELIWQERYLDIEQEAWRAATTQVCAGAGAAASAPVVATVLTAPLKGRSPYPGRADYVASAALFDYYLGHLCPPQRVALQANSSDELHRALAAFQSGPDRLFWYVWGHRTDPVFILTLRRDFTVRQEQELGGAGVLLLERKP